MEEVVKEKILRELQQRLRGPLEWLLCDLEGTLRLHGGAISGEILRIGESPKYGSGYAACVIYGPIAASASDLEIPAPYFQLLRQFNGAKLHAIDLFGQLEQESNERRCLSIVSANRFWINGYRRLPKGSFHFGSRIFSRDENVGYFYDPAMRVFSARKSGEVVKVWPSVYDMLHDEWDKSKRQEVETRNRLAGG